MKDQSISWADDALARLEKVPAGFMRNMTKMRIEEYAYKNRIEKITLSVAEDVIETSRAGMGSAMGGDASSIMDSMKHPDNIPRIDKARHEEDSKDVYYMCFVCGFTVMNTMPEQCINCGSSREKYSVIEKQYITPSCTRKLEWSENASALLRKVPEDFRQEMTKWEIEGFCRRKGYMAVTADGVEERYKLWDDIGSKIEKRLEWSEEVNKKIKKIPSVIRMMVVKEMELFADKKGEKVVSIDTLNSIKDKWTDQQEFHVKWQR